MTLTPPTYPTLDLLAQPQTWVRGHAHTDGTHIELDPATLQRYHPHQPGVAGALMFQLAAVETPQDAATFASRYGLLYHGPDATTHREPFTRWQPVSQGLRNALQLAQLLHQANTDPATALTTLEPLLQNYREAQSTEGQRVLEGYDLLSQASILLAATVSDGLTSVCEGIIAAVSIEQHLDGHTLRGQPGHFLLHPQTTDLAALTYHTLALTITHATPIAQCPGCHTHFTPNRDNQAYCTSTCRNRTNTRRHRERENTRL